MKSLRSKKKKRFEKYYSPNLSLARPNASWARARASCVSEIQLLHVVPVDLLTTLVQTHRAILHVGFEFLCIC
jgi:hypothetical protein